MNIVAKLTLAGTLVLLAACGHSEPSRVQGGAAAGAATGATVGLIGGPVGVAAGAVIGGGAGAIAGASTSPRQVNLGDPIWDKHHRRIIARHHAHRKARVVATGG